MIKTQNLNWVPGECIGPYVLGSVLDIKLLPNGWYPLEVEAERKEGSLDRSYIIEKPDMMVTTENDVIISISAQEFCYYKDQQLIGMLFSRFLSIFNLDPNMQPDKKFGEIQLIDELQTVYSIDSLGAQIWTHNEIIRTVIAGIIYEDDDATIRMHPYRQG
jgi:hypothetical protein